MGASSISGLHEAQMSSSVFLQRTRPNEKIGNFDYALVSQDGQTVTSANYGQKSLIVFGGGTYMTTTSNRINPFVPKGVTYRVILRTPPNTIRIIPGWVYITKGGVKITAKKAKVKKLPIK